MKPNRIVALVLGCLVLVLLPGWMTTMNIKRRLFELERLDALAGLLPLVLPDDAPDADLDRLRRQERQVFRLTDFLDECV